MNIERFHNELAMRLGYERILKNNIRISVEESDDILVTLKTLGHDDIKFKFSDNTDEANPSDFSDDMLDVVNIVREAFNQSSKGIPIGII